MDDLLRLTDAMEDLVVEGDVAVLGPIVDDQLAGAGRVQIARAQEEGPDQGQNPKSALIANHVQDQNPKRIENIAESLDSLCTFCVKGGVPGCSVESLLSRVDGWCMLAVLRGWRTVL